MIQTLRITTWLFLAYFLVCLASQVSGQNLVTYAGNSGRETFNDVYRLPNGRILVAGRADNLSWTTAPVITLSITPAPEQSVLSNESLGRAFILLLNTQSTQIERVFAFPSGTVADVFRIRSTDNPTIRTDDSTFAIYISGNRTTSDPAQDGYFIARLNGNFISGTGGTGNPTGTSWYFPVNCPNDGSVSDYKRMQPWDVGSDGQVVFGRGKAYSWDWAAIEKLNASGVRTFVENWPAHWSATSELPSYRKASSYGGAAAYSGIVLKAGRPGSLRSATTGDSYWNGYNWNLNTDEIGNPRVGKFPDDWYFNKPFNGTNGGPNQGGRGRLTNPTTNTYGDSVRTYKTNSNSGGQMHPTQRLGGIAIDRRDNSVYFGYSTQTSFFTSVPYNGKNWVPDFEPVVVAMNADGAIRWWARTYDQRGISPPDQYIDGVEVDYAGEKLVVLGRQHGSNTIAMWRGNQVPGNAAFQNGYTGVNTVATGHYSWIGKYDLQRTVTQGLPLSPVIKHSTYMMEYRDPAAGLGSPSSDPKLDGWPSPNSGFPDLNTTRFSSPGRVAVTPGGAVCVIGAGQRTITTADAFQKMPKQSTGSRAAWNQFVRIYLPDLSGLVYSSLLTGRWDTVSGAGGANTEIEGIFPYNGGIYAVGKHSVNASTGQPNGNPIPTVAVPTWGGTVPQNESAIFARLRIDQNYPISVQLNPNVFCAASGNNTFPIRFTPPPGFLTQFNNGNVFRAEISAPNGRFGGQGGSTRVIGTLSSSSNGQQVINATFPTNLVPGSSYGLRVRALNPLIPGPGIDTVPGYWYNVTIVTAIPATPGTITGETLVCGNTQPATTYTVRKANNAITYEWEITPTVANFQDPCVLPTCAGIIGGTDTSAVVFWNPNFSGVATIRVRAVNPCGTSTGWSTLTGITVAPCISATFQGSVCAGSNPDVSIPFVVPAGVTVSGVNTFTAQLSDASGSFNTPVNIGSVSNIPGGQGPRNGQINGITIPLGISPGTTYRIRVVGTGTTPLVQGFPTGNITVRTPPSKPTRPVGILNYCFNNIRTGIQSISQFRTSNGVVQIVSSGHGLITGQQVMLIFSNPAVASYSGVWTITVQNNNDFTLNGSSYSGATVSDAGQIVWNHFTTTPMLGVSYFEWVLSNPVIGTFQTNNDPTTIINFANVEGTSWLKVRAVNECGSGAWSDSIRINVESCIQVNLEPGSAWCPGSFMNRTSPSGTVRLQLSKANHTIYYSTSNYRVEISDATGSFVNPSFGRNILRNNNEQLTGQITSITNGPGKITLTVPNHGLNSGANIRMSSFQNGYSYLNSLRDSITVIDANTIRLERATLCPSNCNQTQDAFISGHDLLTPIDLNIPLPATLTPSAFYQIRVSCISNCANNGSSINAPFNFSVGPPPTVSQPSGNAAAACGTTETYSVPAIPGATAYSWSLVPASAGVITGSGNSVSITFSNNYTGPRANLSVTVNTSCGQVTSVPLSIGTNCNPPTEPPIAGPVTGSYRTRATNVPWKAASTWERFDGTNWVAATSYPGDDGSANDDPAAQFIFVGGYGAGSPPAASNHTIDLEGVISVDQVIIMRNGGAFGTLNVNSGAFLKILNAVEPVDFQVFGELRLLEGGIIEPTGALGVMNFGVYRHLYTTTAGTVPTATWFFGSTCSIDGYTTNSTPPAGLGQAFQNFTWNTGSLAQDFNLQGQVHTVLGRFNNLATNNRWLALTNSNTPLYFNNLENRQRLNLNTGTTPAQSNVLTVNSFINFDSDVHGSTSGAAGNLVVSQNMTIQRGIVALTSGSGSPTWLVRGDVSIQEGRLLGNRGGAGFSTRMDVLGNLTINHNNAVFAGSNNSPANFLVNIGGNLQLQNGTINDFNQGGNFTVNVKGDYLQTGGSLAESWVNLTLNLEGNFNQTGGTIGGAGARGSMTFGFTGTGNQNITLTPASYNGNRVSLLMNKPSGQLSVNQVFSYQHFTWIKGNLNLNGFNLVGGGDLILNGTGDLGLVSGSSGVSWTHRWLKAQGGYLRNPGDLLTINGGSGGAVNALNTNSYVADFLKFTLNSKEIANANFTVNGNWNGNSSITLNNHGLQNGDRVTIAGTTNNGGAFNGTYTITRTGANTFTLNGTTFDGNWSSTNTGTLTRIDNFEVPIGDASGYRGFAFNRLRNDANSKTFRIQYKATGANEATGNLIQQVGLVPGILGRNWMVQRVSGSGNFEDIESVSVFLPNATSLLRIGQSNNAPGTTGYASRGGGLISFQRITSIKAISAASFSTSGTWFAIGSAAVLNPPGGGFTVPGNYANLTAVAAEYNDVTFSGPATFVMGSGYNGREDGPTPERFPIVFNRKQNFPVTIRSNAANRETSNSNLSSGLSSALVVFDGVSNITFDGAHAGGNWKFVQYGTTDSANVFRFINGSTGINLRNLDIQASAEGNNYSGAVLLGRSSAPTGNSNNVISNNTIRNNQANRRQLFIKRIIQTERPGYIDGALIIDAQQSTPVICTTSVNHLYNNGQRLRMRSFDPSSANNAITSVTGAGVNPIRITSTIAHGLSTGSRVRVGVLPGNDNTVDVQGNTAANGVWTITVIDANNFTLNGSTANGNFINPPVGASRPTWRCMDPLILNGDYFIGQVTDTTFALFTNPGLSQGYAPKGRWSLGRGDMSGSNGTVVPIISNISSTTPVVITTSANHFLQSGNTVRLSDSLGVGTTKSWVITRINATQFSLNTSTPADFPAGRWQFSDVPLVAVTSVPHGLASNDVISVAEVVFPPNANGNFVTTTINDTTFSLNGTFYYQTPFYGPALLRNLLTTATMSLNSINNTTPIKTANTTSDGWIPNHMVAIEGTTNGIVPAGNYRMWIGGDVSREIIIRHTRKINPPYQGTPKAFFDKGMSKGIVSNNPGTSLNQNNTIEGNKFENVIKDGLLVTPAGNGSRWKINNNHYYFNGIPGPRSGSGRDFQAFNFVPGLKSNSNEIIGNYVGGSQPFSAGTPLVFGLSSGVYTQVILTAFRVNAGDQAATILQKNKIQNINGFGPGSKVQSNNNASSGRFNNTINPNAGLVRGIDIESGLAQIGGQSYEDANWYGDTLDREDYSIDMYGESSATYAIQTRSSSKTSIFKNIIGNVSSSARAYSGNGSFSAISGGGTGSPQIVKNLIRRIKGVPAAGIITNASGQEQLIDSNNISGLIVSGNGMYGMVIDGANNGGIISRNRFYQSACDPTNGVGSGISALEMLATGGGQGWTVLNNQLSFNFLLWGGRYDDRLAGIRHSSTGGIPARYYFNTVYMSGRLGDPGWSTSCFRKDGNGSLVFKNNMLVNETGGGAGAHYGINVGNLTNWNGSQVTNNLFYAFGGNSFLARHGTTQITDVERFNGVAQALNNLESPVFWKYPQPDTLGRLYLNGENCPIKDKGVNVGIFDDYDSLLVRDKVLPDIGSHEFSNELPLGAFWIGGVNNDWHLDANWCDQKVPQAFEDVTISNLPRRRNMPIVSTDDAVCRNLRLLDNPGSMLTIWGDRANLTVYGDSGRMQWTHANFANITGAMTFGSDSVQSIPGPPTEVGYSRRNLSLNPMTISAVAITANAATITTTGNHNLNFGEFVRLSRIAGVPLLNGSFKVFRVVSGTSFEVRGSFTGTYTGNAGIATPLAVLPIRAMIVGTNSIEVQLSRAHGLSNGQYVSLTGVKGIDAANGAFAISNATGDRFDIPVKTFSQFIHDTNAVMIPSLTGFYDLRLAGSNTKFAEGAIQAASVMATNATFITNKNSLELRDSLIARNGGRIIIENPTTTTVGSHFTRNGVGSGAISSLGNSVFGIMSADSGRIDFGGTDLVVNDTIRVRRSGTINLNAGRIFSKNAHAFRGQINQSNAEVTVTRKLIASAGGRYSISGTGFTASRDSIWVKRNGIIQTEAASSADLLALNFTSMLGGSITLSGSGNLYSGNLFLRSGLINTGGQNRVVFPGSTNINFNTVIDGNDTSFVNGRVAHQHGRLVSGTALTNIVGTAGGNFTLRTGSNHGFATGDVVLVQGLTAPGGNRANGTYTVDVVDNTNFRLRGSVSPGAINAASPGGTVTRLLSRVYPVGKQTEYRPMQVFLDQGTVGETALSLPLTSFSNNSGVGIFSTAANHNFRNRQAVSILNSGLSNVNPICYIQVESPNSFRLFNDFLLSANPNISGTLAVGATVLGHAEYVAEAFLTKPDSLLLPLSSPSWFGSWSDQVVGVHQSRYSRLSQISHLPTPFRINGGTVRLSYRQTEINPGFHNNKYLTIVKDSLWPTLPSNRWLNRVGNNVDSVATLKTIQGVKPFTTPGVFTLGFLNILPCNHEANAGRDTTFCHNVLDSLGSRAETGFTYRWRRLDPWQAGGFVSDSLRARLGVRPINTTNQAYTVRFEVTMARSVDCEKKDTVEITVLPGLVKPIIDPAGPLAYCPNPVNTQFMTVGGYTTYTWILLPQEAGEILGDSNEIDIDWNDGFSGLARLVVFVGNDCGNSPISDTVRINIGGGASQPTTPVTTSGTTNFCTNPADFEVSTTPVGGASNYIWQVHPVGAGTVTGNGVVVVFDANNTYNGLVRLVVRVETSCGNSPFSDSLRIVIAPGTPRPNAPTATPTTLCPIFNSLVSTNPGLGKYVWEVIPSSAYAVLPSDTNNTLDINWNDGFVGTAKVVVRAIGTCGASEPSDTLTFNIIPGTTRPDLPTTTNATTCAAVNSTATTNAGLGRYNWQVIPTTAYTVQPGDTNNMLNINWNPAFVGTVRVFASASNACGTSDTSNHLVFNVIQGTSARPDRPATTSASVCAGNSTTINTNVGLERYRWEIIPADAYVLQPGDTTSTLTVNWASGFAGDVRVVVRSIGICDSSDPSDTLFILVSPSVTPQITGLDSVYCASLIPVNLTLSPAGGQLSGPFISGNTFTPSTPGLYEVKYIAGEGDCRDSVTLQVRVAPQPVVSMAGLDSNYCFGNQQVILSGSPSGGVFSGSIMNGNRFTPNVRGTHVVRYTFTSADGCADSVWARTNIFPAINPLISGLDTAYCEGNTPVNLAGTPAGGVFSGLLVTGNRFTPIEPGIFPVRYRVEVGQCADSVEVNVLVRQKPIVSFTGLDSIICRTTIPVRLTGSPAGGVFRGPRVVESNFIPDLVGNYRVTYTFTDEFGCLDTATNRTQVKPVPTVNAGNDLSLCIDAPGENLSASPANGFWTGLVIDSAGTVRTNRAGRYNLVYNFNLNGCFGRDTMLFTVRAPFEFNLGADTSICLGDTLMFFITKLPGYTYQWSNGSRDTSIFASTRGTFWLRVSDNVCPSTSDSITIRSVDARPKFELGPDTIVCPTRPIILSVRGLGGYAWSDGTFADTLKVKAGGRYILTGFLNNPNCTFTDTIQFEQIECPDLLIPDAFSPNGDGVSDIWQLRGLGITEFDLTIYNAWGEVVFVSKDQKKSWDGTYRGKVAPVGIYKYLIKYKVEIGDRRYQETKTGTVTLVR